MGRWDRRGHCGSVCVRVVRKIEAESFLVGIASL